MNSRLGLILSWVVTLLAPIVILMLAVRLLLVPAFLQVEYRMPGFPEDTYGFTLEERFHWATPSLLYLIDDQGIDSLGKLAFDDGTPIYNERELKHVEDVKSLLQVLFNVWYAALAVVGLIGLWAWRSDALDVYRAGWRRGGFLMIGLLVLLAVFAVTSFWEFFIWFHKLFFSGDSWMFAYSDTLIRLFPVRFWQDCFIYVGGFALVVGLVLAFAPRSPHFELQKWRDVRRTGGCGIILFQEKQNERIFIP